MAPDNAELPSIHGDTFTELSMDQSNVGNAIHQFLSPTAVDTDIPPIMRVPTEIRTKIFKYLLPEKIKHIEPTRAIKQRKAFEQKLHIVMVTRLQLRARAQHKESDELLKHSGFYGDFDAAIHTARSVRTEFSTDYQIPMDFGVASFGGVYDMGDVSKAEKVSKEVVSSPSIPPLAKQSPSSASSQRSTIFITSPTKEEISKLKEFRNPEQYNSVPAKMTLNLLTTCSLFATEIATILYEEYTFEIHVYPNGIDFLHLPRISTYEYCGMELADKITTFLKQGHFCFQRMRHLLFVLHGDHVESRTSVWRMRRNVEHLVGMIGDLASLTVKFAGKREFYIVDLKARMGTADASVVEMVCAPFAGGLFGVNKVEIELPPELRADEGLVSWKKWIEDTIMGSEKKESNCMREMKEAAMFEASLQWEYRQAFCRGNHLGDHSWLAETAREFDTGEMEGEGDEVDEDNDEDDEDNEADYEEYNEDDDGVMDWAS
jgi:hypothetical protein